MTRAPVAVVVTCYNLGRTLEETLDSVARQTIPPEESVLIDDGSTDIFTRQVLIRSETAGHRVIRIPNRGVSVARNTGVNATFSPYIVLLDADDVLEPTYVEQCLSVLESRLDLSFVSTGMRCFGAADETWFPPHPELVESLVNGVVHISSMLRRTVWNAVGGYDITFDAHEDVDFWTRVLKLGFRGEVLQEPLLRYRVRLSSKYHADVQRATHLNVMRRFYLKHADTIDLHAERLLIAKERFILGQRAHEQALSKRKAGIELELQELKRDIEDTVRQLHMVGRDRVEIGDLRTTRPLSPTWGTDRGQPLDRYYIESFLNAHRSDVRGRVVEIKDDGYTVMCGGDRVTQSDVLDIDPTNERATIVADLTKADSIPDGFYDCIILTQTLGLIYDVRAVLQTLYRILAPGGVLLCTLPASGRISYESTGLDGDYWRFTEASTRALFADVFPIDAFEVVGFGNVLACSAFLYGLAPTELTRAELDDHDPYFPVVYGVRAAKARPTQVSRVSAPSKPGNAVILMYHRIADHPSGTHPLCVSPEHFRQHLQRLSDSSLDVVSLSDLVMRVRSGGSSDASVALTFDDGYEDAYTCAAQIASAFSFPATYFVVGAALDPSYEFWWDTIERVFLSDCELPASLRLDCPCRMPTLQTSTRQQRIETAERVRDVFYLLSLADRQKVLDRILSWSGVSSPRRARPMTPEQLRQLAVLPGADIGAHSENHLWLPTQPEDVQALEISASKARIERFLGKPVTAFSYPYGGFDDSVRRRVREAGFELAVTTEEQPVRLDADPLLLPRLEITDCDGAQFTRRILRAVEAGPDSTGAISTL